MGRALEHLGRGLEGFGKSVMVNLTAAGWAMLVLTDCWNGRKLETWSVGANSVPIYSIEKVEWIG